MVLVCWKEDFGARVSLKNCNVSFTNKARDFIKLIMMLQSRANLASVSLPFSVTESDLPMVGHSIDI